MNFGNPEKPKIMGQFVGCIRGMSEACLALDFPVVSGNVSLYNETQGEGIQPTPSIGGVGLLKDVSRMATIAFQKQGQAIVLIGVTEGHLGSSLFLREIAGREEGAPPPVDLAVERRNGDFVRRLIESGTIDTCHDLADGGLAVALAEMCLPNGIGASIVGLDGGLPPHAWMFGEDQARYLIAADDPDALLADAAKVGVPAAIIGKTGGERLDFAGACSLPVSELRRIHEGWLPKLMA